MHSIQREHHHQARLFVSIQLLHQLSRLLQREQQVWCTDWFTGGVTATWAANTITISGTPTAAGTFNYSIPLTGGCGNVNATGTITVNALNTAGAPSSSPTVCINTAIAPAITIATTGATGIGALDWFTGRSDCNWAANTITISGTPTAAGTFNYSIPLTGGCGNVNATGTITVMHLIQREHHHQARLFVSIQLLHQLSRLLQREQQALVHRLVYRQE